MPRFHAKVINGTQVLIQYTPAEEAERDAEEAAAAAAQPARDAANRVREAEERYGPELRARWMREIVIAVLPATHPQRGQAEETEAAVRALGVRTQQ